MSKKQLNEERDKNKPSVAQHPSTGIRLNPAKQIEFSLPAAPSVALFMRCQAHMEAKKFTPGSRSNSR
jgi:hypothetical protein